MTSLARTGRTVGVIENALAVLLILAVAILGLAVITDLAARVARSDPPAPGFWASMLLGLGTMALLNVAIRLF
jgi:hypothetical protein